jgi:aminopeptidase YwaD
MVGCIILYHVQLKNEYSLMQKTIFLTLIFFSGAKIIKSQSFTNYAKPIIEELCSKNFAGRGYQKEGLQMAAQFLSSKYKDIGLKSIEGDYFQFYRSNVNVITNIDCKLDGQSLKSGYQYLINPGAKSFSGKFTLRPFSITNPVDKLLLFQKANEGLQNDEVLLLKNIDTLTKLNLIKNFVVKSSAKKLMWSVSDEEEERNVLTLPDTIINQADQLEIKIENNFVKNFLNRNIIGYIPGKNKKNKDLIVFTAHYDHLGMMGKDAMFPGASDNASGVAMLLSLANYYSKNKLDHAIAFILFSGEENGLLGSKHFVENPLFDLSKVKMLINLDIMGCAEQGVTVVNAEKEKRAFDLLVQINNDKKYLPEIKPRGKAANSDHYFFSEAGVPAIFLFSNGGQGFYHDVWDTPATINLKNFDEVAQLLIEFVKKY